MDDQSTAENEWFYGQSGKKNGPVSQAQILQLIQSSIINRGTLVWKKGFSDWQKIENTELRSLLENLPPHTAIDEVPPAETKQTNVLAEVSTKSKREQINYLNIHQSITPLPIIAIAVFVVVALSLIATPPNHIGFKTLLPVILSCLIAFNAYRGKLIHVLKFTSIACVLKLIYFVLALFAFKLLVADEKIVQDELDFLELALLGELVGTAFFLWMHIYVKNKADPDDLALAKKLKLVWF